MTPAKRPTKVVYFRTFCVDLKIEAPTVGAYEDFERELKRALQRTVNTQTRQRRHYVKVTPPAALKSVPVRDVHFPIFVSNVPHGRRSF